MGWIADRVSKLEPTEQAVLQNSRVMQLPSSYWSDQAYIGFPFARFSALFFEAFRRPTSTSSAIPQQKSCVVCCGIATVGPSRVMLHRSNAECPLWKSTGSRGEVLQQSSSPPAGGAARGLGERQYPAPPGGRQRAARTCRGRCARRRT